MAWNGSDGRPAARPSRVTRVKPILQWRWIVAGIVGIAIIGLGAFFFVDSDDDNLMTDAPKANARERSEPRQSKPSPARTNEAFEVVTNIPAKPSPPPFVKRPGALKLPDGRVLTFKPPKEGEYKIVHSHGAVYKCDHLGNWEDVTPKPVFDNAFEESLVGMATSGNFIPGVLMGLDYDYVIKMLTKPVEIKPDDSEDVVAKKQAVSAAKEAILDYMKDGASFDDFVMDMRKQVVKERTIKGMALKEIVRLLKEGNVEDAADMREAAGQLLERETGGKLTLPSHIESSLEEK